VSIIRIRLRAVIKCLAFGKHGRGLHKVANFMCFSHDDDFFVKNIFFEGVETRNMKTVKIGTNLSDFVKNNFFLRSCENKISTL
jgi:hypothetical protein